MTKVWQSNAFWHANSNRQIIRTGIAGCECLSPDVVWCRLICDHGVVPLPQINAVGQRFDPRVAAFDTAQLLRHAEIASNPDGKRHSTNDGGHADDSDLVFSLPY
ncbi:hypothetical protein [Primorskyibacter flagellatus]|uniref:hypothetical protein n=1 Tax=Primorskyibacter flagellatus TaxID=1387277 RepID=UPI003A91AA47